MSDGHTDKAPCYIGTAGWSVPRADLDDGGPFCGAGSQLERYARTFNCVEINSSFYRPHRPSTYARWRCCTPPEFRFAVKLPKLITHELRLRSCAPEIARFASEAGELREKFAVLLVQLPPSLGYSGRDAAEFFTQLREQLSSTNAPSIVCEARHASWFSASASDLLAEHDIVRVVADPPAVPGNLPVSPRGPAYTRLHGSPRIYYSGYSAPFLDAVAASMRRTLAQARPAWCIFDNTAAGCAVPDALALRQRIQYLHSQQCLTESRANVLQELL
ncbi:MAG TPA: DUF72 domain-containing protein [Burkholderiaceae bacterium]